MAVKFDVVLCALPLVRQFNAAKQKGVVVVGLRDVTNENEMEKAMRDAGLPD